MFITFVQWHNQFLVMGQRCFCVSADPADFAKSSDQNRRFGRCISVLILQIYFCSKYTDPFWRFEPLFGVCKQFRGWGKPALEPRISCLDFAKSACQN